MIGRVSGLLFGGRSLSWHKPGIILAKMGQLCKKNENSGYVEAVVVMNL